MEIKKSILNVKIKHGSAYLDINIESKDDLSLVVEFLELLDQKRRVENTENSLVDIEPFKKID